MIFFIKRSTTDFYSRPESTTLHKKEETPKVSSIDRIRVNQGRAFHTQNTRNMSIATMEKYLHEKKTCDFKSQPRK